jgi:hypothetical protein
VKSSFYTTTRACGGADASSGDNDRDDIRGRMIKSVKNYDTIYRTRGAKLSAGRLLLITSSGNIAASHLHAVVAVPRSRD